MKRVTVIGPGRMGGALAIALFHAGYIVDRFIGRDKKKLRNLGRHVLPRPTIDTFESASAIDSDIIFITTPDPIIAGVANWLTRGIQGKPVVFHVSGALSSGVLQPLAERGLSTGSIHPLLSVSSPTSGADKFAGTFFCLEGGYKAQKLAKEIVRRLGGKPFTIKTEVKPLYHLAAVMSSGHLVALADVSFSLMEKTGLSRQTARKILIPLIRSTVANLGKMETSAALTGPVSRGDISTVRRHIAILESLCLQTEADTYLDLALRSIEIARRDKCSPDLQALQELILLAKQNSR